MRNKGDEVEFCSSRVFFFFTKRLFIFFKGFPCMTKMFKRFHQFIIKFSLSFSRWKCLEKNFPLAVPIIVWNEFVRVFEKVMRRKLSREEILNYCAMWRVNIKWGICYSCDLMCERKDPIGEKICRMIFFWMTSCSVIQFRDAANEMKIDENNFNHMQIEVQSQIVELNVQRWGRGEDQLDKRSLIWCSVVLQQGCFKRVEGKEKRTICWTGMKRFPKQSSSDRSCSFARKLCHVPSVNRLRFSSLPVELFPVNVSFERTSNAP